MPDGKMQNAENFDRLEEPNVKDHDETINTVERWRDIVEDLEPSVETERSHKERFQSISDDLIRNADVYNQDFFHGTTMHPIDTLFEEMWLRSGSAKNKDKCGEHQALPKVSSTSNIYDALSFSHKYTPVISEVKSSVEKDIIGRELPEETSRQEIKNIIGEALDGEREWLIKGEPLLESDFFLRNKVSVNQYRKWLRRNYSAMWSRIEDIGEERDPPAIFSYPAESLTGDIREVYTPLFENELRKSRLSEIQSDYVDLMGKEKSIFVPDALKEDFAKREGSVPPEDTNLGESVEFKYEDRISIGSIEALKIYQLAKNSENYREKQMIRNDTTHWQGKLIIPSPGFKRMSFDEYDLSSNPYRIELIV